MDLAYSTTVLLVVDDPSIRASLRRVFQAAGHHVRAFSTVAHLSAGDRPPEPCCLVMDVQLHSGESSLAFKERLDRAGVRIPTIFIAGAGTGDVATGVRAMKAGAFDVLAEPFDDEELLRAAEAALVADARLLDIERRLAALRCRYETLTARERDVFFAVTRGLLNKQVAVELGVSEKTVKVHRGRVTEKLAADSVAELVRMADRLQSPQVPAYGPGTHRESRTMRSPSPDGPAAVGRHWSSGSQSIHLVPTCGRDDDGDLRVSSDGRPTIQKGYRVDGMPAGAVTSVEHLPPAVVVHVLADELRKPEVDAVCAAVDSARAADGGAASAAPFVLDLARVTFAGSLALGVLLGLKKEFLARGQRLIFVNLQRDVRDPIQISRMDRILEILPDVPAALQAVRDDH